MKIFLLQKLMDGGIVSGEPLIGRALPFRKAMCIAGDVDVGLVVILHVSAVSQIAYW